MCRLATESSDWLMIDDWECKKDEYSRTVLVLNHLQQELSEIKHGDKPIRVMLLCGADLLDSFNTAGVWAVDDMHTILGKYGIVVFDRSGSSSEGIIYSNPIIFQHQTNIILVPNWINNEVSSTKIRQFVCRGLSIKYLLPESVIAYIQEKGLWKDYEQQ
eukprot:TRINITY_DN7344_c0_g1_i2.p1 TRINITY_DN7344_c0_g1~~TRINITY_DN7344_c0_g1_i2.p1  ORF type:complete len:160 (-),score=27.27 TRINITY_DN7344_c0_g1_i2:12-491(-)